MIFKGTNKNFKTRFLEYLFGNPLLTILQTCYLCATQNVLGICDAFRLHHETCQTIQHLQGKASPVANDPTAEIESSKNIKKQTIVWKKINNFSKIPLFLALNSSKFHHIFSSNDINFQSFLSFNVMPLLHNVNKPHQRASCFFIQNMLSCAPYHLFNSYPTSCF